MSKSKARYIYLSIGWFFCGLGFAGAFLPILPTVPFLLVAAWAFSKSSPRLRTWLVTHPRFGPSLQAWFDHGAISRPAKFASLSLMACSVAFTAYMATNPYVPIIMAIVLVAVAAFIITRPTPQELP